MFLLLIEHKKDEFKATSNGTKIVENFVKTHWAFEFNHVDRLSWSSSDTCVNLSTSSKMHRVGEAVERTEQLESLNENTIYTSKEISHRYKY
jgi:hypothetical protein